MQVLNICERPSLGLSNDLGHNHMWRLLQPSKAKSVSGESKVCPQTLSSHACMAWECLCATGPISMGSKAHLLLLWSHKNCDCGRGPTWCHDGLQEVGAARPLILWGSQIEIGFATHGSKRVVAWYWLGFDSLTRPTWYYVEKTLLRRGDGWLTRSSALRRRAAPLPWKRLVCTCMFHTAVLPMSALSLFCVRHLFVSMSLCSWCRRQVSFWTAMLLWR